MIELADLDGVEHSLSAMKGKVVLVNFWATWCPPCIQEMPSLVRLADSIQSDKLIVLAVNVQEKQPRVKRIVARLALDFPVLLDHSRAVADAWDIKVFPSSFVVDAKGDLRFKAIGPIEWDSDEAVTLVKQLLVEQTQR